MGQNANTSQPFLQSLASDATANTIAIAAASLVPLMAMVGGGVDASRYYMAETRLQAACDAGALAARRSMDNNGFKSKDRTVGENFFDHNFPDGLFGLDDMTRQYSADGDNIVNGTASGIMPTTIMAAFGYQQFEIDVACSADINISNTDIMFVLDVTGSMNCRAGDQNCGNNGNVEAPDSKIDNLRDSVMTFYDTVDSSTSAKAQVRYGIMPYSNQVNVGNSLQSSWMKTNHEYQSREGDEVISYTYEPVSYEYNRVGNAGNWSSYSDVSVTLNNINSKAECKNMIGDVDDDIFISSDSNDWTYQSSTGDDPRISTYSGPVRYEYLETYEARYRKNKKRCILTKDRWRYTADSIITAVEDRVEDREFRWIFRPVTWNVSGVTGSKSVTLPTGWEYSNQTHNWKGCIEEAETVATTNFTPVPAGAYDLDIDLVPSNENEKWAPMLPSLVFTRYNGNNWTRNDVIIDSPADSFSSPTDYCPKAARKLAEFDNRSELERWVSEDQGFVARGATYHDFGMIWGARFISPSGIFASENETAPSGDPISRHIVFMTDGTQSTANRVYGLYGMEWWNRKITNDGNGDELELRHGLRFQAACRAARNKNISVWVIAFDTTETDLFGNKVVPQNLRDCATPGRAYLAEDADDLDNAFREIAEKIAALRLTA